MTIEENKELVRTIVGALWRGELDAAHEHPGYWNVLHTFPVVRDAFPDLQARIDAQVAEGDLVATQLTLTGTHTGTFLGGAATGRRIEWGVIYLDRVEAGKIVAHSGDGWMDALIAAGAIPPPG